MFIQTEQTPNPATLKFLPGQTVLDKGTAEFKTADDAAGQPLPERLFKVTGVQGVFMGKDFISISKADDTDWIMLKPMILSVLMEHLSTGQPILAEGGQVSPNAISKDDDEVVMQIKELIEERVRPSVMMDGGDIVFDRFEEGVVFLRMQGACSGCPSSTATLKMGIENMLRHYIPEVEEVQPVAD